MVPGRRLPRTGVLGPGWTGRDSLVATATERGAGTARSNAAQPTLGRAADWYHGSRRYGHKRSVAVIGDLACGARCSIVRA